MKQEKNEIVIGNLSVERKNLYLAKSLITFENKKNLIKLPQ